MKKFLSLILTIAVILSVVPAYAAQQSGTIAGTEITWTYDDSAKTLTLSGKGVTPNSPITQKGVSSTIAAEAEKIIVGEGITELGYQSLKGFSDVTEVQLPSTLKKLLAAVFDSCKSLTTVNFPSGLEFVGNDLFLNCKGLTKIPDIPASVTYFGYNVLRYSNVTKLSFASGRETELVLPKRAFASAPKLVDIRIPENVSFDEEIADVVDLFDPVSSYTPNDTVVKNITIWTTNTAVKTKIDSLTDTDSRGRALVRAVPASATVFGAISASHLKDGYWTYGDGVLNIYGTGDYTAAHWNCTYAWKDDVEGNKIDKIVFNEGITSIPAYFTGQREVDNTMMTNITAVGLPSTLKTIGKAAFIKCFKLTTIEGGFPEGLESIADQAFMGCPLNATSGNALYFPSTLKSIGNLVFASADRGSKPAGYTTVSFAPNSQLETIGDQAFWTETSIDTVVIPKSVKSIGEKAFECNSSKAFAVYFEGIPETIGTNAFNNRSNVSYYCFDDNFPSIGNANASKLSKAGDAVSLSGATSADVALTMPTDGVENVLVAGARYGVTAIKSTNENKLPGNFEGGTVVSGVTAEATGNYVVKFRGLPELAEGEKLVVTLTDAEDSQGNVITDNTFVFYNSGSDLGLISAKFYDMNGSEVIVNSTKLEAAIQKMVFTSVDSEDKNVALYDANGSLVKKADFENGTYTVTLDKALTPKATYTLKRNGSDYIVFTADEGKISVNGLTASGTSVEFKWYNSTANNSAIYIFRTKGNVCEKLDVPAGKSGTYTGIKVSDADVFVTDGLSGMKILAATLEADDVTPVDKSQAQVTAQPFDKDANLAFTGNLGGGKHLVGGVVFKSNDQTSVSDAMYAVLGVTDDSGALNLSVKFGNKAATGLYTAYLCDSDGTFYANDKIAYAIKEDATDAFKLLNDAAKSANYTDDVYAVIEANATKLGFVYDVYDNTYANDADKQPTYRKKVAAYVANEIRALQADGKEGFTYDKKADAVKIFREASVAAAFSEGQIADIANVSADISVFSAEPLKSWYGKNSVSAEYTTSWRQNMTARLNGASFKDLDEFYDKVTAAMLFAVIKAPDGTPMVKDVLNDFGTYLKGSVSDFDISKEITDKACASIADEHKDYTGFDYKLIVDDIREYNKNNVYDEDDSSSGGNRVSSVGVSTGVANTYTPSVKKEFSDIQNHEWAKEAINALREKGIISGKSEEIFAPDDNVLREEFVKMIVIAANLSAGERSMSFSDVSSDAWFNEYIVKAYSTGIVNGIDENTFGVGMNVTRQDMCVIIANVLKAKGVAVDESTELSFADGSSIADYAKSSVAMLTKLGLINGYEDGTFRPEGFATRAETAKIIYALLGLM